MFDHPFPSLTAPLDHPTLQTIDLVEQSRLSQRPLYLSPASTSANTSPVDHSFYSDCSAAGSMTSLSSPSSNASGELDSSDACFAAHGVAEPQFPGDEPTPVVNADQPEPGKKRGSRRIWTHALEKFLFTPHEIATLGAPHRRTIYLASLEAHIDRLHSQLLGLGLYPIPVEELQPYKGLNCKTAKGMVAGLQHDFVQVRMQILEMERAEKKSRSIISVRHEPLGARKYSLDSSMQYAIGSQISLPKV